MTQAARLWNGMLRGVERVHYIIQALLVYYTWRSYKKGRRSAAAAHQMLGLRIAPPCWAAPASDRYALSANGLAERFVALRVLHDWQRFAQGIPPERNPLMQVMVRRLKRGISN